MDTLNDLNERVDAFVGTSSFDTPAAANDQAPIDVPAEVHEDIVASVDFSEVELADEFTEPQVAVTPNGLLPMEPLPIDGRLRKAALRMPDEIEEASGFTLFGRRIKSVTRPGPSHCPNRSCRARIMYAKPRPKSPILSAKRSR